MNTRLSFYLRTVAAWIPDRTARILVVAGGPNDRDVFMAAGFSNVTISNLDDAPGVAAGLSPYAWSRQDVESLSYDPASFDYVVVHAGLHHCRSPHRGLLEMYRVAKRAVLGVEPCDNGLVRGMQRLGLAQVYEQAAVHFNGGVAGGVRNTAVPNFVYRWTPGEIRKTISAFEPEARHAYRFAYGADLPGTAGAGGRRSFVRGLSLLLMPAYLAYTTFFPGQQNLFAFMVFKPEIPRDLHPWLEQRRDGAIGFRAEWGNRRFGPAR